MNQPFYNPALFGAQGPGATTTTNSSGYMTSAPMTEAQQKAAEAYQQYQQPMWQAFNQRADARTQNLAGKGYGMGNRLAGQPLAEADPTLKPAGPDPVRQQLRGLDGNLYWGHYASQLPANGLTPGTPEAAQWMRQQMASAPVFGTAKMNSTMGGYDAHLAAKAAKMGAGRGDPRGLLGRQMVPVMGQQPPMGVPGAQPQVMPGVPGGNPWTTGGTTGGPGYGPNPLGTASKPYW